MCGAGIHGAHPGAVSTSVSGADAGEKRKKKQRRKTRFLFFSSVFYLSHVLREKLGFIQYYKHKVFVPHFILILFFFAVKFVFSFLDSLWGRKRGFSRKRKNKVFRLISYSRSCRPSLFSCDLCLVLLVH